MTRRLTYTPKYLANTFSFTTLSDVRSAGTVTEHRTRGEAAAAFNYSVLQYTAVYCSEVQPATHEYRGHLLMSWLETQGKA